MVHGIGKATDQNTKKKKSKDKQQGVFLAQFEARKGSKGKVTAQRKRLVKV